MKCSIRINKIAAAVILAACSGALVSHGTDGTWLAGSGSGNWSDGSKWASGDIADGAESTAAFQLPGSAPTVTLDSARTIGRLELLGTGWTNSLTPIISGANTLTFDNGADVPVIKLSDDTTVLSFISGPTINVAVAGSNGLRIEGVGRRQSVAWNPSSMGITGGITLDGAIISIESGSSLGNNTITLSGTGKLSFIRTTAETTISNNIVIDGNAAGFMGAIGGDSVSVPPSTQTITGVISSTEDAAALRFTTSTNGLRGNRFILDADNIYDVVTSIGDSALTTIHGNQPLNSGPVVVQATRDASFGTGSKVFLQKENDAVELVGGITLSQEFRLRGQGFRGNGSLNSLSGDNTVTGAIEIFSTNPNRIGVESDSLTLSGNIVSTDRDLEKVGEGKLILSGNNVHRHTQILDGTLVADSNTALGVGTVTVNGGVLSVAQGRIISNTITFGDNGGKLSGSGVINSSVGLNDVNQVLSPGNSPGTLSFAVNQTWSAFTYDWEISSWTINEGVNSDLIFIDGQLILNASGEYVLNILSLDENGDAGFLSDFVPGIEQSWIIATTDLGIQNFDADNWLVDASGFFNDPSSIWAVSQVGNQLVLSYIPEPSATVWVGVAMLVFGFIRLRRRK